MIITNRDPQEAWWDYVDRQRAGRNPEYAIDPLPLDDPGTLPMPTFSYPLHASHPERVIVFSHEQAV